MKRGATRMKKKVMCVSQRDLQDIAISARLALFATLKLPNNRGFKIKRYCVISMILLPYF